LDTNVGAGGLGQLVIRLEQNKIHPITGH